MPLETAGGLITKAFTLAAEDVEAIEEVKAEEGYRSSSAAVRRLLQDGRKYRDLLRKSEANLVKKLGK